MEYIDLLWTEAIVVNEVYPEPSPAEIGRLAERGIETWHVVGMKALSVPAFPKAYQGGIPCCAGTLAAPIQPILQRLTQTTANKTEQGNR